MRQLSFPGLEPRKTDSAGPGSPPDPPGVATQGTVLEAEGQLQLFEDRARFARDLEIALRLGDFEEARRVLDLTEETFGPSTAASDLAFLERLGSGFWQLPVAEIVAEWWALDNRLEARPALRRALREGVFTRLLAVHPTDELAAASPSSLPALANVLTSTSSFVERGIHESRRLVRDALLSGQSLLPHDFEDPHLRDLLADDLDPVWMACRGAIRRLWPAPPPSEAEVRAFEEAVEPEDAGNEAARHFWLCLRIAETPECPEARLHEARKRMKRLHPDLHAAYMRRLV